MTNPKLNMSASVDRVDRSDVRRPQHRSWQILKTRQRLLVVLLVFISGSAFLYAADIPALVRAAKPAVVQILCYDQNGELVASGTGFFISPDGKLLTNSHLLEGKIYSLEAKTITGQIYSNWRILSVPQEDDHPIEEDVAQIQFFDAKDVPYLSLGSSKDLVEGQRVLVIGNPEGLTGTVSDGLIAAFRKKGAMIQITAPISHGSSGSPVLDESGNVIGIATAGREEGQNLNFAVSADAVRNAIAKSVVWTPPATDRSERPHAWAPPTPTSPPGIPNLHIMSAWAKESRKDFRGAIADCTDAIRLDPHSQWTGSYYSVRGYLWSELEQYAKAISDCTDAIRLDPPGPAGALAYRTRSLAYESLGNHSKAKQDRRKAEELEKK